MNRFYGFHAHMPAHAHWQLVRADRTFQWVMIRSQSGASWPWSLCFLICSRMASVCVLFTAGPIQSCSRGGRRRVQEAQKNGKIGSFSTLHVKFSEDSKHSKILKPGCFFVFTPFYQWTNSVLCAWADFSDPNFYKHISNTLATH